MQLTRFTDYSIRVLLHVGARDPGDLSSIAEIAQAYDISRNHLMKVVQDLGQGGFLETVRGRKGGLRLGRAADRITIGQIVRHTETSLNVVDCTACIVAPACILPRAFQEATRAFLTVLDGYTLADSLVRRDELRRIFGNFAPPALAEAAA